MNGISDKRSQDMLAAIQELTRENERLTTELGAAQETIDLFESYRTMTQEYMKMCICSSRHYIKDQYKKYEQIYEQLAARSSLHSSTSTSSSSLSLNKNFSHSNISLSPASSGTIVCNGLSVEIRNGNAPKSKVGAYLDSLSKNELFVTPSSDARAYYQSQSSNNIININNHHNFHNNNNNNNNVIRNSRISRQLFMPGSIAAESLLSDNNLEQFQQKFNNFLMNNQRYNPKTAVFHAQDSDEDEHDDDDEDDDELDSLPPPLLSRRMLFDGNNNPDCGQQKNSESILGAMLENGCKSYQMNYKPKALFQTSPITGLSITKFDENNNSKRTHLTLEERSTIIDRLRRHEPGAKIAREYGITKQAVSAIKRRANIVINEPSDVSLIVKKAALSSPESGNGPIGHSSSGVKKFARKFPKEMNAFCLPVNPVELIKSQQRKNESQVNVNPGGLLNFYKSLHKMNSNANSNSSSNNNNNNHNLNNATVKEEQRDENCTSAMLLSKLLKGEDVQNYEQHPKSLLIHESSSSDDNNLSAQNDNDNQCSMIINDSSDSFDHTSTERRDDNNDNDDDGYDDEENDAEDEDDDCAVEGVNERNATENGNNHEANNNHDKEEEEEVRNVITENDDDSNMQIDDENNNNNNNNNNNKTPDCDSREDDKNNDDQNSNYELSYSDSNSNNNNNNNNNYLNDLSSSAISADNSI